MNASVPAPRRILVVLGGTNTRDGRLSPMSVRRLRRALAEDALTLDVVPRKASPDPPAEALSEFSEDGWQERFAAADTVVAVKCACDPAWPPVAASLALIAASGIAAAAGGVVMDPAVPRLLPRAGGDEKASERRFVSGLAAVYVRASSPSPVEVATTVATGLPLASRQVPCARSVDSASHAKRWPSVHSGRLSVTFQLPYCIS